MFLILVQYNIAHYSRYLQATHWFLIYYNMTTRYLRNICEVYVQNLHRFSKSNKNYIIHGIVNH